MSHVTYSFVTGNGNGNGNDSCDSLSHNGNPLVVHVSARAPFGAFMEKYVFIHLLFIFW